jgi:hypothetical protein
MANDIVIRGGIKVVSNLALGTGDDLLTRNSTTKEVGYVPAIDDSNFLTTALPSTYVIVGNASNIATAVQMTGDVTITDLGVTSIAANVITNNNINSAAAIQYSKLNLTAGILNSDISNAAAITRTKLADGNPDVLLINNSLGEISEATAITPNMVLVSDPDGIPVASGVSSTVIEFLDISSSLQTTLDDKLQFDSAITPAEGDIIVYSSGAWTALNVGAEGEVLAITSGVPAWTTGTSNGLPSGGTAAQILTKIDGVDYNTQWVDLTLSLITDVTASAAEVNLLDGATFTAAELNFITGASSNLQAQLNNKLAATLPHNAMFVGNTSNVPAALSGGTNGQVLQIVGGTPVWQTITGTGTVTSIDVSGGTTGLSFTGGPISTSGTITLSGTLDADNGGTGQSSYTIGDILYASTTTALSKLGIGTAGQVLQMSGGLPTWQTITTITDGDKGDVTISGTGTVYTVDVDIAKAWTGAQSWRDNNWSLLDNSDTSKILNFQLSSITTATTRTLTIPDQNGTIAVLTDLRQNIVYTSKTAHGFVVEDAVKVGTTATDWSLVDGTVDTQEDFRGIVVEVIDADNFVVALPGSRVTGLSGLTPGATYYAQSDGSLNTSVTLVKVLYADTATTGYMFAGGGSGAGGHTIQWDDYSFAARTNLNFVGNYVEVTDDAGNDQTDVEIIARGQVGANFDGQGSVVLVNSRTYFRTPRAGSISAWSIVAEGTSPTCTIDIWKVATGTTLPTVANTIMGTKPALATGNALRSTTFTGWSTTTFAANDIWCINIDACSAATKISFYLEVTFD